MDREEGIALLRDRGWLSGTPPEFQRAILSRLTWHSLQAGAPIQEGGEEVGELVGLASGIVEIRPILGRADTPIVHFAHPVFWFGYVPIVVPGGPRRLAAAAKTSLWLGRVPQGVVRTLLAQRPEWWRELTRLSIIYGDVAQNVAADLLIRDSERRCAAVLLRLGGHRFPSFDDGEAVEVPVTQDDLAAAANLSRNSVGTMLQKLKARGLVEPGYRTMTICTPNALRAFVDKG